MSKIGTIKPAAYDPLAMESALQEGFRAAMVKLGRGRQPIPKNDWDKSSEKPDEDA